MFGTSFGNSASSGGAFAPSDISGLKLWLDADAANVNTEAAADFSGTNQYLSSTSTAFNKGNESFSFGGWVYIDVLTNNVGLFGKYNLTGNQRSYQITMRDNSPYNFRILITPNGSGTGLSFVDDTLEITTSTWYFVVGCYDSDNEEIKLSVNGNNYTSATHSTGADSSVTEPFTLGKQSTLYFNGREDLTFFYDKALSQSEVSALYNSGNATAYSSLSAAQKTDLVSWWSLSETRGTRYDQVITSANNLTDNGSVGWAAGILDEPVVNDSPVTTWINKGEGTRNATQPTAINQPIWKSSGFGTNSKPYLTFDGTNSFLRLSTDYSKLPNHTVFVVYQIDATINSSTRQCVIGDLGGGASATGSIAVVLRDGFFETNFGDSDTALRSTQRQNTIDTVSGTTYITTLEYTSGNSLQTVLRNNSTLSLPTVLGTATSIGGQAYEMRVGQWGTDGYYPLDGKVSEILIYNTVLTTSEVESVNDYLNTKYAAY